ncbi:Probable adenine permease PurP [Budvicia aquatica]|uniref:Probable adenine permease PurP n=1 Tax=Budvicia aquatica TaxID=82979 RepID=A0A484ZT59_9GAMM|nr:Probable adenine permease PurP [Budvicia aquatica]
MSHSQSQPSTGGILQRIFKLHERNTNVRTETLAGITGFLAAAYLLVVIPGLLAAGGMDKGAVTTGTILVFVFSSLLMAFYGNLPFIVGPGIGGSVLVGITLASNDGIGWQIGLGIACWSGILFFLLTVLGLREVVTRSAASVDKARADGVNRAVCSRTRFS